jgi:ABC-type phosphate/phosphonate transport system substrate-binding protein
MRNLLRSLIWSLFAMIPVALAAAPARPLVMAISEGTSGGLDHAAVRIKYGGLAEVIERAVGQPVNVVFAREFRMLEAGISSGEHDFVMARPSDYPARGIRDHGYRYVAHAQPDGQCLVIVPKASPVQALADTKGRRWVMPERISYMSKLCHAEMRDQGIDLGGEKVQFVREQGAVTFYLANGFGDVGTVASYSGVARKLEADGFRVVHRSVKQPYFPLVAGRRISEAQVQAIQAALAALPETGEGQAILKKIGIQGFDTQGATRLGKLLDWLGP